jgi:hypothetical protein
VAVVYRHIRLDKNEPFYIGISKGKRRPYTKNNRNKHWNNIVAISDYEVEILFEDVDISFAKKKEVEFIELYGRRDLKTGCLCNLTEGGEFNRPGYKRKLTEDHKRKTSESMSGEKCYMYGVPKSEDVKKKISLTKSKKVIDIVTKKIYKNGRLAALDTKYSYRQLFRFLNNQHPNKTNMVYLENYKNI